MKLIGYMLSAEKGEAAEFVAMRGFDYFHHDPEVSRRHHAGHGGRKQQQPQAVFSPDICAPTRTNA